MHKESLCGGLTGDLVSLRSGDALTAFGGGLRFAGSRFQAIGDGRPCFTPSPYSLFLGCWHLDARDFVAGSSSPAAPSRSSQTIARTARRCCWDPTLMFHPRVSARRVEQGGMRYRPWSSRLAEAGKRVH